MLILEVGVVNSCPTFDFAGGIYQSCAAVCKAGAKAGLIQTNMLKLHFARRVEVVQSVSFVWKHLLRCLVLLEVSRMIGR